MSQDVGTRFAAIVKAHEVAERFAEAISFHSSGQVEQARACYLSILTADPHNLAVLNNLALLSPPDVAEQCLRRALALNERYLDALLNLARLLRGSRRHLEAKGLYLRALAEAPGNVQAVLGLGEVYDLLGDYAAAIDLVEANMAAFGHPADAYCRLGKYCESLNRPDDALVYLLKALELNPEHAEAHVYAGRQYLKKGDYRRGAEEIAWIWHGRLPASQIGLFVDAAGQSISQHGRTVVLSADSGLGDTMQFVRYAPLLEELGARVVVESQPELVRLLSRMPAIDRVVPLGGLDGGGDVRLPLHNLIGAFRTTIDTIPHAVPYLTAYEDEAENYRQRMAPYEGLRVGLCWSGNPSHPRNADRSVPPGLLTRLFALRGVTFFSLQKGGNALPMLVDWSSEFHDLANTAALVENLDLVITVDTAVAHLAAALGRPTWLLNRFDCCWRWLEDRRDSPWYPTMTQFRQQRPGQWSDVLSAVATELSALIESQARKKVSPR